MLIRALIVFLAILNLGVALWWVTRADAPATATVDASVQPTLVLMREAAPSATANAVMADVPAPIADRAPTTPAPVAATAPAAAATAPAPAGAGLAAPPPPRCHALGPFADEAGARQAVAALGAQTQRSHLRQQAGVASAYTVYLPPAADRATAQATAQKITAAGFDDLLVISNGELANGVALGRYSSRERAEQRQAALRAAGFAAQLQPVGGEGKATWWADVAVVATTKPGGRVIDCAALR